MYYLQLVHALWILRMTRYSVPRPGSPPGDISPGVQRNEVSGSACEIVYVLVYSSGAACQTIKQCRYNIQYNVVVKIERLKFEFPPHEIPAVTPCGLAALLLPSQLKSPQAHTKTSHNKFYLLLLVS